MNNLPKWLVNGLGGLLIVFVALLILQQGYSFKQVMRNAKPSNTISVSGEGRVSATPDLATVTIGVLSQGTTAVDVKNQNNEKVNKVVEFIKKQGVEQKDINTSQFSFYPTQDWSGGTAKITGYQGNQTITVKVRGVDKSQDVLEKVLDGAVNSGANQINGVNLTVEKPTDLQNEARKQAIEDAKKKAQELAAQAGLKLGKVVSVSESSGGYPVPMMYESRAVGMGGGDAKSVAPDIQNGSQEITEIMNVVFEVR